MRPLTDAEREALEAGLRSSDAFTLRRCQILLASARGERAPGSPRSWAATTRPCATPSTPSTRGAWPACARRSHRPQTTHAGLHAPPAPSALRALLHQSPRTFGKPTSLWTLELAAEVSFEQGLTATRVSGETIRATLARLGVRWKRAKHWITSPDPEYARKKARATA